MAILTENGDPPVLSLARLTRFLKRLGLTAAVAAGLLYLVLGVADTLGTPLLSTGERIYLPPGHDFVAFFAAATMVGDGLASAVYDVARIHATEIAVGGAGTPVYPWLYPPTFLLAVAPLAWLPYLPALILWLAASVTLYCWVAWRIIPDLRLLPVVLAFPAIAQCLISGQNSLLFAALFGAGLLSLERRPWLAGLAFGLFVCKPQLAVLLPFALIAGRHWHAVAATAVAATAVVAVSLLAFGVAPWQEFVAHALGTTGFLEAGQIPWPRMPTVFAALSLAGLGKGTAYTGQLLVMLVAAAGIAFVWARPVPFHLKAAALCLSVLLATPYGFDYDMPVIGLGLLWLACDGERMTLTRFEWSVVILMWFLPLLGWGIAAATAVQITPITGMLLLGLVVRRAAQAGRGQISPSKTTQI